MWMFILFVIRCFYYTTHYAVRRKPHVDQQNELLHILLFKSVAGFTQECQTPTTIRDPDDYTRPRRRYEN